MATVFKPEHSPLDQIFAASSTYRIPAYQRPYSWESMGKSDRDSQVVQLWDDLWDFFEDNQQTNREYFLGSMVIIEEADKLRTFEVIDGQQRLTTLLLLFAAIRCFLLELQQRSVEAANTPTQKWISRAIQTLESFLYNEEGPSLVPTLKLKVERTLGLNFNQVLENAVKCQSDAQAGKIEKKHLEIAQRYYRNRDYFIARLKQHFPWDWYAPPGPADIQKFDSFFKFLRTRVALVLIKTSDFSTAYRIFEILNNRGLPLSNLDLLRNFVIEQLAAVGVQDHDERWETLEKEFVFTEDFIGRWTESVNAAQPQTSAFNDAKRMFDERFQEQPGVPRIEVFYDALKQNLGWYNLLQEEDQRIEPEAAALRDAITFIKRLGNERYSIDLLLALFRLRGYAGGREPEVLGFLQTYRSAALYIYLLGRFSSSRVYDAIRKLNEGKLTEARALFVLKDSERDALYQALAGPILKNEDAKLLLAGYVWNEELQREDVVSQHLYFEKSTLEHILPQDLAAGSNWLRDFDPAFRKDFTYRLGNMTLLTQSKNSSNRNFDWSRKRPVYAKSKLPMTVELAAQTQITPAYLEQRQRDILAALRGLFLSGPAVTLAP